MKRISIFLFMILFHTLLASGQINSLVEPVISKQLSYSLDLCKHLHQNPELSLQEFETAKKMAQELEQIGFEVTSGFGGNNVVGIFKNGNGPVIMLRADMDALPIEEKTKLKFASTKTVINKDGDEVPVMHACGHDIHMSIWLGTLRSLVELKNHWEGTLFVIAQQAEELSRGAKLAINNGLFSKYPVPDLAMAFHINPELEAGRIGLIPGPIFAGVKTAEITVFGKGGHGAYPEKCIDPVVIASRIVLDIQTIVSREINPLEPVVITVGSIHGGTRPNIIPEEVKMELTLRYYNEQAIEKAIKAIKRVCDGAAATAGMPKDKFPEVHILSATTPPVINNGELSENIHEIASGIIGDENIEKVNPAMTGEDFGYYGTTPENVPICLMWLGCTNPEEMKKLMEKGKMPEPLHSPYLNPDFEKTIYTGMKLMTANVLGLMKK